MKQAHRVALLLVTLLTIWLILNGTPALNAVVSIAGSLAAAILAVIITIRHRFQVPQAMPRVIATALLHTNHAAVCAAVAGPTSISNCRLGAGSSGTKR